jgi:arylsulfatase B
VRLRESGYMTTLLSAEAERLVHEHAARHSNASLFLWLSLNAPHVPLQAPDEWLARQSLTLDTTVRTYAAMVGAMDDAFGRTTSALRAAGMLRDTLIAFMSDNGGPSLPTE